MDQAESGNLRALQRAPAAEDAGRLSSRSGPFGRTLMHDAAERGNVEMVQYLATHARGTVCAPDDHKTTPLHLAASGEGHAAVVHALLQHGASAAASDVEGQTPLHLAASRGTTEVIRLLPAHGTPVNSATLAGWTPLHGAAFYGRALAALQLLKMGASLHIRNKEGNTPLHLACLSRHLPVTEVLLAAGADMDVPNGQGQSPASMCTSLGSQQLFEEERARRQQQQQQQRKAPQEEEQREGQSPFEAAAKDPAPSLERLGSFNWKPTRRSIDLGFPLEDNEADGGQAMAAATAQRCGSIGSALSGGRALSCMRSRSGGRRASFWDQLLGSFREDDDGGDGDGPDGSAPPPPHGGGAGASAAAQRSSGLLLEGGKGSAFLEHAMAASPTGASPAASLSAPWSWLRAARAGSPLPPAPASQQAEEEEEEEEDEEQGLGGVAPRAKSFTFGAPAVLRPGAPTGGAAFRVLLSVSAPRDGVPTPQPDVAAGGRPLLLPAAPRLPRALCRCSTLDGPIAAGGGGSAPQPPTSSPTPPLTPPEAVPLARQGSSSSRRASASAPKVPSAADADVAQADPIPTAVDAEHKCSPEHRKQAMYMSLSMRLAATQAAVGEAPPPARPPLERTTSRRASMINVPAAAPAAGRGAAAAALIHSSSNARAAAAALLHSSSSAKAPAAAAGFAAWSAGSSGAPPPPPGAAGLASFRRRSAELYVPREGAGSPPRAVGRKAGILRTSGGDGSGGVAAAASRRFVKTVSFSAGAWPA